MRPLLLRPTRFAFLFSKGAYGAPFVQIVYSNLKQRGRRPETLLTFYNQPLTYLPYSATMWKSMSLPSANAHTLFFHRPLRFQTTNCTLGFTFMVHVCTDSTLTQKRFDSLFDFSFLHQQLHEKHTDHCLRNYDS